MYNMVMSPTGGLTDGLTDRPTDRTCWI